MTSKIDWLKEKLYKGFKNANLMANKSIIEKIHPIIFLGSYWLHSETLTRGTKIV